MQKFLFLSTFVALLAGCQQTTVQQQAPAATYLSIGSVRSAGSLNSVRSTASANSARSTAVNSARSTGSANSVRSADTVVDEPPRSMFQDQGIRDYIGETGDWTTRAPKQATHSSTRIARGRKPGAGSPEPAVNQSPTTPAGGNEGNVE